MGQSATLYRIDQNDFSKVTNNPEDFGLFEIAKEYMIFEKTFEGLRFVLSKFQDIQPLKLADQIFYPTTFIGEQIDYANLDYENISDDFDLLKQPVYYSDPDKVSEISLFLDRVTVEGFQNLFDSDELNKEEIYPYGIWNKSTDDNHAFNKRDMTEEYKKLVTLFKHAQVDKDYILSYVG